MKIGSQVRIFYNDTGDHVTVSQGRVLELNDTHIKIHDTEHDNEVSVFFSRIVRVVEESP